MIEEKCRSQHQLKVKIEDGRDVPWKSSTYMNIPVESPCFVYKHCLWHLAGIFGFRYEANTNVPNSGTICK